jgi:hypothetical protein
VAGKTEVFSGKFCFSRRQASTKSVILIMCRKTFPPEGEKTSLKKLPQGKVFSAPLGLVIIKITRPKQKKKKNWDNFLPKGRPCGLRLKQNLVVFPVEDLAVCNFLN